MTQPPNQEKRKGRVTASNAGAILGFDPNRDDNDVLRMMVREYHGAEREFKGNVATEYGTFHEKGAIQDLELREGVTVSPGGWHEYEDWLGASPDGFVDGDQPLEVKCPYSLRDKLTPSFKGAAEQPHYYAQMQVQMVSAGADRCWFYQWAPHGDALEIVHRDEEWINAHIPDLQRFHQRYLSELDNPDHLEDKRKVIENRKAARLIEEYDQLSEAQDNAKERQKDIIAALARMTGDRDADICGRKFTRVERAGSVSYAKVVKDHCPDVDLEAYRGKGGAFWKLT